MRKIVYPRTVRFIAAEAKSQYRRCLWHHRFVVTGTDFDCQAYTNRASSIPSAFFADYERVVAYEHKHEISQYNFVPITNQEWWRELLPGPEFV